MKASPLREAKLEECEALGWSLAGNSQSSQLSGEQSFPLLELGSGRGSPRRTYFFLHKDSPVRILKYSHSATVYMAQPSNTGEFRSNTRSFVS